MYIQQPRDTIVFDSNELYVQITCGKFQHVQNVM